MNSSPTRARFGCRSRAWAGAAGRRGGGGGGGEPTGSEGGIAGGVTGIAGLLREAARAAGVTLDGVGVGSSGPIDHRSGVYGVVDNLPGWSGEDLAGPLGRALATRI